MGRGYAAAAEQHDRLMALHRKARQKWVSDQPGPMWKERHMSYSVMVRVTAMLRIIENKYPAVIHRNGGKGNA